MTNADPARAIGGEPASGDQAVQVDMRTDLLAPGVQHGQEAKLRSQMAWVGGNGLQGLRNRPKQDVEEHSRILQSEASESW